MSAVPWDVHYCHYHDNADAVHVERTLHDTLPRVRQWTHNETTDRLTGSRRQGGGFHDRGTDDVTWHVEPNQHTAKAAVLDKPGRNDLDPHPPHLADLVS